MNQVSQAPSAEPTPKIQSAHEVALSLLTAVVTELVFKEFTDATDPFSAVSRIAVVFLTIFTAHKFALISLHRYRPKFRDLLCLTLVILGSVAIVWFGRVFALGLSAYVADGNHVIGEQITLESLHFAIPFSAGGLILQAVLGLHHALVFAVCFSIIVGIYSLGSPLFVPSVLVATLVGCLSLVRFRSRAAYLKAGLNIALVSFPFVLASVIIDGNLFPADVVMRLSAAFIAGALCSFLAAGITPVLEHLGGYVTDMRLIEMATLDHPLLKELSIQAPGTWNHSMVMGMMGESAADAIGANAVVTRVGAYFHDIGKMKKPLYFVENQRPGENRHDKLSTSMSALIIRSHVKDGLELAKKHMLPQGIEDMISQHHGTSIIEFFYNKAVKEAEESEEDIEVDISLYTYPGPKPQTREAGILMLADGIEAACRTLNEPTHDRIQGLVQKMINKVFASGELNECELTLTDLHLIAKCFTRVLTGIYHQRIAYAEPAEKVSDKAAKAGADGEKDDEETSKPKKESAESGKRPNGKNGKKDGEEKKDSGKENLKRLGI